MCRVFASKCIDGIEANVDTMKRYAESSPSIGTALNPHLGYETTAEIIKESTKSKVCKAPNALDGVIAKH